LTTTTTTPIRIENASRIFQMGDLEVPALVDANLEVEQGEFVVVLGPSGSGKSTLLNLIGGLDRPTAGHVWFQERDLTALSDEDLTRYRRESVGFVFQFYNLVPTLTALENVQVATELVQAPLDAAAALELVGLAERAAHFPAQLSGGEQQRVSIARALAKRPDVLLADEPTGALDLQTARVVLGTMQQLNREQALTIVLITHNPALAALADRRVQITSGRIVDVVRNEAPAAAADIDW